YTPRGASVSPHCDAARKLGSQVFYFNDEATWDPAWGGETCVLDDGGRYSHRSNPDFADFDALETVPATGNQSLLFARRGHSWHGVRELTCPEGELRRVFIMAVESTGSWWRRPRS
ncbi:MAG: 2OG-Fe(II) oxygenase, partial [Planctomycetota bacterium]|nr:2OG-Fe(II) oxygenase [Planctomycetota bacterium]